MAEHKDEKVTFTRTHTYVTFADPNLRCDTCSEPVARFHDPERCGCESAHHIVPCGHVGVSSDCPSWGPVDGCRCPAHPHMDRVARPGKPSRGESPCCPGAGSMAHVRGCQNHPEADRG